jgi:hypothetical protein
VEWDTKDGYPEFYIQRMRIDVRESVLGRREDWEVRTWDEKDGRSREDDFLPKCALKKKEEKKTYL